MKQKYYTYTGILCWLLLFAGCDKDSAVAPGTQEKAPITLSAAALSGPVDIHTRAESLNGKPIGIMAAKAMASTPLASVDWTGYYLDHVRANGTDITLNGEEKVVFESPQYWPFSPADYLAFVAYSPYYGPGGDSRVIRVPGTNRLKVTPDTTDWLPDFLYTEPAGVYNKESAKAAPDNTLSLGEFRHAMAKLEIRVVVVDKQGDTIPASQYPNLNPLVMTKLAVSTKVESGEFDLTQAASPKEWTSLDNSGTVRTVQTYIDSPKTLTEILPVYADCILLPGTQENSFVIFQIKESNAAGDEMAVVERTAAISEFLDEHRDPVALEAGKIAKLAIKIMYVSIPDPGPRIFLEGQLVEWDYRGKSNVVIE